MRVFLNKKDIEYLDRMMEEGLNKTSRMDVLYTDPQDLSNNINGFYSNRYRQESIFGREMNEAVQENNRILKEMDKHLKGLQEMQKKFRSSPNGMKYFTDLSKSINELFLAKMTAVKNKVDFLSKKEKSYRDDLKDARESGGVLPVSNTVGTTNDFIKSVVSNTDDIFTTMRNQVGFLPNSGPIQGRYISNPSPELLKEYSEDVQPIEPAVNTNEVKDDTVERLKGVFKEDAVPKTEPVEAVQEQEPEQEPDLVEDDFNPMDLNSMMTKQTQSVVTATNAYGQPIQAYTDEYEGIDDYYTEDPTITKDLALAKRNLEIKNDPNYKLVFKYNEEQDAGYIIAVNLETGEEVDDITTFPMNMIYPWVIDYANKVVTTFVREEYDLVLTEDPLPDWVIEQVEEEKAKEIER